MISRPSLTSGSGGSSDVPETQDDPYGDDYNDTIDLGKSGPGGNQTFDLQNNAAAAVETSDVIEEAGGPGTVLAGTQEQVTEINKAVSEVSSQIRDQQQNQPEPEPDVTTTGIPQEVTAARNAASAAQVRSKGMTQTSIGGLFAGLVAFFKALLGRLFGGQ